MSISVRNLDIRPKLCTALIRAHVNSVEKILVFSNLELRKRTGLVKVEVDEILSAAAKTSYHSYEVNALDLFHKTQVSTNIQHFKLSTGSVIIDEFLNGGLLYPGIIEICGESASGKTQLCLQLCLYAQREKSKTGCLYICTEDVFPHKRLTQMASCFFEKNKGLMSLVKLSDLTDYIFIEHASDLDSLWTILDVQLPAILSSNYIKILIVDSIAALFRVEFSILQIVERAKVLSKFGSLLHKLSHKFGICIICVNQVMDNVVKSNVSTVESDLKVLPALGLTWSYSVTTRIMLSRTQLTLSMVHPERKLQWDPVIRSLSTLFSPNLASSKCYFIVNEDGVMGIPFFDEKALLVNVIID